MFGLIVLLLFCAAVGFMFLMACVNPTDPSLLGTLARVVTKEIPSKVGSGIRAIPFFGPFCLDGSQQLFNYVAFKPNPILQIVYAALVFGGYGIVLWEAYPQIPNMYMGGYHRYIGVFVVGMTLWAWFKACTVSPGYITSENYKEYDNYAVDEMLYTPDQYYTYKDPEGKEIKPKVPKLPRSKHCSISDHVVSRFDHFCPWLNNAVGEKNYKYFLLFLLSTAIMLWYGAAASGSVVLTYIKIQKLFDARYVNKVTGQVITASKKMVFQYCMHKQQTMMMLFFLCGIMGIVVFCFFLYHVYLISRNRTTNENFKWSSYQHEFNYNERKRVYLLKKEVRERRKREEEDEGKKKTIENKKSSSSTATKVNKNKNEKWKCCNFCPSPIVRFFQIWLHGCFIVSCGMCGVEEENGEDEDEKYDFSGPEFQYRRSGKYMYKLNSFKENLMEVLYPRSERSQEERNKFVTWNLLDNETQKVGKKNIKKKNIQKKRVTNGNWSYFHLLLIKKMKGAGDGASIQMIDLKKND